VAHTEEGDSIRIIRARVARKPEVAKAFPNDKAVNDALLALINVAEASARASTPAKPSGRKRRSISAT
jgi:hypothetical protein